MKVYLRKQKNNMSELKYYTVYLASPFFRPEQIERVEFIENILEDCGYTVFSPRKEFVVKPNASSEDRKKGFAGNCEAIDKADFILAVTDGKDMGTIWEAGYAFAKHKPILYFAETLGNNDFNLMLAESGLLGVCKSRKDLERVIIDIQTYSSLDRYISHGDKINYEGSIE